MARCGKCKARRGHYLDCPTLKTKGSPNMPFWKSGRRAKKEKEAESK